MAVEFKGAHVGQDEPAMAEVSAGGVAYEYAVLVTSLHDGIPTLAQHYRGRADAERRHYHRVRESLYWRLAGSETVAMSSNTRRIGLGILVVACAALLAWRLTRGPIEPIEPGVSDAPVAGPVLARDDAASVEPVSGADESEPDPPQIRTLPGEATLKDDKPAKEAKAKRVFIGTGVINVSVIGLDGKPTAGANVTIERIDWQPNERPPSEGVRHEDITGADGVVRFDKLPDGEYVARAHTANGMQSADIFFLVSNGTYEVALTLWEAAPVAGRVVDTEGHGIPGALVYVYETDRFPEGPLTSSRATQSRQITDGEGRFLFAGLWTGKWRLYTQADGFASETTDWFPVPADGVWITLGDGGAVSGTVVDSTSGGPVADIPVAVRMDFVRDQRGAKSGPDGAFRIEGVRPGDFTLAIEDHEVVLAGKPVPVRVRHGQEVSGIKLRVVPGGIVRGRVYDKGKGTGVGGVRLGAYVRPLGESPQREVTSAFDGTYEIRGLAEGVCEIRPYEAPGYPWTTTLASEKVSVTPGDALEGIDIALDRGLVVRGRVLDEFGGGVVGAYIEGSSIDGNRSPGNVMSDATGYFELAGFGPGEVEIRPNKLGFERRQFGPFRIGETDLDGVEIEIKAEAVITGIVVDKQGRPVVSVPLSTSMKGETSNSGSAGSLVDGSFRIDGLSGGEHLIRMSRVGENAAGEKTVETVTIRAGETLDGLRLVYDFPEGGRAAGRALDSNGDPITGVVVVGLSPYLRTQTDNDGRYALEGIEADKISIQADHRVYSATTFEAIVGSEENDFVMEGCGTIEGKVVNSSNGEPIRAFEIAYSDETRFLGAASDGQYATKVNEEGEFVLENVEVGSVKVHVQAGGFANATVDVADVRAGETISGVELRMDPAAALQGIVLNARGTPVAGAEIFAGPLPESRQRGAVLAVTDADGAFKADTLSPDTAALWAYHKDYLEGETPVSLESGSTSRVDIVLLEGGSIEGIVRVAGVTRAGVSVTAHDPEPPNMGREAESDANGHYRIGGLPAQSFSIIAIVVTQAGVETRQMTRRAEVEIGTRTAIDLDFAMADAIIEGHVTHDGKPVGGAHVSVATAAEAEEGEGAGTQADGSGYYRIERMRPGTVSITVQDNRGGWNRAEATLASGVATRVDIDLKVE